MHPAAEPEGQPRLLRVRRELLRRPPGRGHRRLHPVHRQGPRGPAVHRADLAVVRDATTERARSATHLPLTHADHDHQPVRRDRSTSSATATCTAVSCSSRPSSSRRSPADARSLGDNRRLHGGAPRPFHRTRRPAPSSWQSAQRPLRPARPSAGRSAVTAPTPIGLNTLGDLTNRENRALLPAVRQRFRGPSTGARRPDNWIPTTASDDDNHGDGVPDYYPTLYPGLFPTRNRLTGLDALVNETCVVPDTRARTRPTTSMAFPYIFPGAYSQARARRSAGRAGHGWLDPQPRPVAQRRPRRRSLLEPRQPQPARPRATACRPGSPPPRTGSRPGGASRPGARRSRR